MEGQFKDDALNGYGRLKLIKEDTIYEGEFFKGNKEGWGLLTWADNSQLEGNWIKGKINGIVIYNNII